MTAVTWWMVPSIPARGPVGVFPGVGLLFGAGVAERFVQVPGPECQLPSALG